jgi:hypothetical protein
MGSAGEALEILAETDVLVVGAGKDFASQNRN